MNYLHSNMIRDFMARVQRHGLALPNKAQAIKLSAA